ncbi:TetR/AcrR family transcriptional regulator [Novosphingobium sp. KCTC 2891]|uniref:TetR/AcrR family transcriptional regulator n=1 Tax=Novosphingobium sp. KCTC 2891 TaxID=2989730 RepID=UPI002222E7F7|nr:TetR/AcrR family transcriptional regulator [Novosphingobium sp. KCTC 2891]MCW1384484.1 TetR/AcrR family transcriptional regulator [Novosphingobium sp. KCTC 2891]
MSPNDRPIGRARESELLDFLDAHPDKPLVYVSPLILERRKRLLRVARQMIAEKGIENFSVRQLCQRAQVAQRTLYNAFHNKDRMIALAIREAFDDFNDHVRYRTDENTLRGMLDRTIAINRRNFKVRNYTKAIVSIYFGHGTPRDVWETLRDMSVAGGRAWLDAMEERGELQSWISPDHFVTTMANLQYATINNWTLGRLSDEEYIPAMVERMLLLIIGAVRSPVREEAQEYLMDIRRTGKEPRFPHATWGPPVPTGDGEA